VREEPGQSILVGMSELRTIRVGRRSVPVRELEELEAVRGASSHQPLPKGCRISSAQAEALERAGWSLVSRAEAKDAVEGESAKVLLLDDEDVALSKGDLVVQFVESTERSKIDRLLADNGLKVLQPLPVEPATFRVGPAGGRGGDAIDAATRLARVPEVVFAEPELIEAIGPR